MPVIAGSFFIEWAFVTLVTYPTGNFFCLFYVHNNFFCSVALVGLEPTPPCGEQGLILSRLPIPPQGRVAAEVGFEPTTLGFKVLRATIAPSGNLIFD